MSDRSSFIKRKTRETDINLKLDLDGTGIYRIRTGVPMFDHLFSQIARHGLFDITLKASGMTNII